MLFKAALENFVTNQNHYDLSPHTYQDGHFYKN